MTKLVCFHCLTEYKIIKTGGWVIEMFGDPPQPYKIWSADGWKCPGCDQIVMAGFPRGPIAEHHEDDFEIVLDRVKNSETAKEHWVIYDYEKAQQ